MAVGSQILDMIQYEAQMGELLKRAKVLYRRESIGAVNNLPRWIETGARLADMNEGE